MGLAERVAPFEQGFREFARLSPHLWQPLGEELVRHARLVPGEHVLDACCGEGASAIPAARVVGSSGHVDAVDAAAALIEVGRSQTTDLPQLSFACADVTEWAGGPYDVVQCAFGVFFFPDMDADTAALLTLLRPGGRLVVSAWKRGALRKFAGCLVDAIEAETGTAIPEPSGVQPAERIDSEDKLGTWLSGFGLSDVDVRSVPFTVRLTDELSWDLVIGTGFRAMVSSVDDEVRDRVRLGLFERLRERGIQELDAAAVIGRGTKSST